MAPPHSTGFRQQTKALVQKSWAFQKRNVGTNICLCIAPIFFCVILAILQALVNLAFLSSDQFKCGCFCTRCCPDWAFTSKPNNFTVDGTGKVTVKNLAAFGGEAALANFPNSTVTRQSNGDIVIDTCNPIASGACPTDLGYSCKQTDNTKCGMQFSSTQQSQWCGVPQPSAWPPVWQTPSNDTRKKPWGSPPVPQPATLVTANDKALQSSLESRPVLFHPLSEDLTLWNQSWARLYSGNANDPQRGNIFNGDQLSVLGFTFGSDADPQTQLYIDRSFQNGQNLYVMVNSSPCVARNITTNKKICMSQFLAKYFNSTSGGRSMNVSSLLTNCTPGDYAVSSDSSKLLDAMQLRVICTENAVVGKDGADVLEDDLYCGYYQARCNLSDSINNKYQNGLDFQDSSASKLAVNVYYNKTDLVRRAGPNRMARIPGTISSAVTAWWQHYTNSQDLQGIQLLGVMSMPKEDSKLQLDFSSLLGPLFYCWVVQLLLPTFLQQLVYEKEKRLRMMMKMHGLGDTAYWAITYLWYLTLYIIYIIIFIAIGAAAQLKMFTKTNLGVQIIFYFLFGNCMIAFAFLLSSLFSSSRTAVVVAFLYVFATGLIGELLLKVFMDKDKLWVFFVEWIPAFALYRGLYEMSTYTFQAVYTNSRGLNFAKLKDAGNGMAPVWGILIVEWAVFMLLGLYLEQVVSSNTGIRRSPLFFLEWMWRKKDKQQQVQLPEHDRPSRTSVEVKMTALQTALDIHADAAGGLTDVQAERERVIALDSYQDNPIVMKDIKKVYPAMDGGKPKTAVRSMTLGIQRGECFGLLGPNGAGKTTCINMMVGFLEPSAGTGMVEGYDIRTQMQSIYKLMGVCPQHDLLWDQLTAREHLRFYGTLKGHDGPELESAIDAALKSVNLYNGGVGDKLSGKYSGGMKRRLSVAISFIGAPRVVYLDEPSTGLDPASRRNLWEVVKSSKSGRSIILTTHSMEEAEQLCDRLGIFVEGQLVCIGAPKEITSRYAGFYVFTISVPPQQEEAARAMVLGLSSAAVLTYALGGTLKYELPSREVSLSDVFRAVNQAKAAGLTVIDWGVANATLEEVFIKLAKNIGATSADES